MEQVIQLNSSAKLSEHFTLGELTKTSHKVYNIPSHEAIENLKRVCVWLEYLRKRYNEFLDKPSGKAERNQTTPGPSSLFEEGSTGAGFPSSWEEGIGAQFCQYSTCALWMQEGNVQTLSALARLLVNQANALLADLISSLNSQSFSFSS